MGKQRKQWQTIFLGSKITADGDCSHEIKTLAPWKESYDKPSVWVLSHFSHVWLFAIPWTWTRQGPLSMTNLDIILKSRHHFDHKGPYSQSYDFYSSHVWRWELDHKESWALKNWCFGTEVLEKTLESPLVCKETRPVHPKGNKPWSFIGRTDAEAEAPIL